jgi:hypothetical protein
VFLLLTPHLCNTTCEASYARDKVSYAEPPMERKHTSLSLAHTRHLTSLTYLTSPHLTLHPIHEISMPRDS